MGEYKFKKHESFYIREGWFEKAINVIKTEENSNIFFKNEGVKYLGIGTNMVKSLKYWLSVANVIKYENRTTSLTEFGELIYKYDQYLVDTFVWSIIHLYFCRNSKECPVINNMFYTDLKYFSKADAIDFLYDYLKSKDDKVKKEYIEDDFNVFIKTYYNDTIIENPEDNYVSPLTYLNLLTKKGDKYEKKMPSYNTISYLVIYYALTLLYKDDKGFSIEESMMEEGSPYKVFNLDKNMYFQYLEEMRKHDLVKVSKTAGLNFVYIEKRLSLADIFKEYFGGK